MTGKVLWSFLLDLNLNTFANIPLRSHTIHDIREVSWSKVKTLSFYLQTWSSRFIWISWRK